MSRKWLPVQWADETVPTLLDSPDAFIFKNGAGYQLRLPEEDHDHENEFYCDDLEHGQIVEFMWHESYGDFIVTVNEDRTFSVNREIPGTATHFWADDGSLGDSLEDLVNGPFEPLEPGQHEVSAYYWSDGMSFKLEIEGDSARFVSCAGVS